MAVSPGRAVARRAFSDARSRTTWFGVLFALAAYANAVGYRGSYPTLKERLEFAASFGNNKATRLFYGVPHDLLTDGGYAAWRVGGMLSIFAGLWGILAAVRALRAEEELGRQELVLSGIVGRRTAFLAALTAIAAGAFVLWLALWAGLAGGRLQAGPSAFLALATIAPLAVFAGIGAVICQLVPTRRMALEAGSAALGIALLLRVVADTSGSLSWMRWISPLGWTEEMRPFAGARPAVLLLPLAVTVLLLVVAGAISMRRDVGNGLLPARDTARPRLGLLGSPTAYAFRAERGSLLAWFIGIGFYALIVGLLSTTLSEENVSERLRRQIAKLGGASITTPTGAIGLYFLFFVLTISLFACAQIAAARREEDEQRLETLFALPVDRRAWLLGRLGLAVVAAAVLGLSAGVLAWAGAESQGAHVSFMTMLGAGANCLPATVLFLGLGALAFAIVPRASAGIAYGLVALAFVWELFGSILGAPKWTLGISPFHQVALVPAQPFKATAAIVMVAVALACAMVATWLFRGRDLAGA